MGPAEYPEPGFSYDINALQQSPAVLDAGFAAPESLRWLPPEQHPLAPVKLPYELPRRHSVPKQQSLAVRQGERQYATARQQQQPAVPYEEEGRKRLESAGPARPAQAPHHAATAYSSSSSSLNARYPPTLAFATPFCTSSDPLAGPSTSQFFHHQHAPPASQSSLCFRTRSFLLALHPGFSVPDYNISDPGDPTRAASTRAYLFVACSGAAVQIAGKGVPAEIAVLYAQPSERGECYTLLLKEGAGHQREIVWVNGIALQQRHIVKLRDQDVIEIGARGNAMLAWRFSTRREEWTTSPAQTESITCQPFRHRTPSSSSSFPPLPSPSASSITANSKLSHLAQQQPTPSFPAPPVPPSSFTFPSPPPTSAPPCSTPAARHTAQSSPFPPRAPPTSAHFLPLSPEIQAFSSTAPAVRPVLPSPAYAHAPGVEGLAASEPVKQEAAEAAGTQDVAEQAPPSSASQEAAILPPRPSPFSRPASAPAPVPPSYPLSRATSVPLAEQTAPVPGPATPSPSAPTRPFPPLSPTSASPTSPFSSFAPHPLSLTSDKPLDLPTLGSLLARHFSHPPPPATVSAVVRFGQAEERAKEAGVEVQTAWEEVVRVLRADLGKVAGGKEVTEQEVPQAPTPLPPTLSTSSSAFPSVPLPSSPPFSLKRPLFLPTSAATATDAGKVKRCKLGRERDPFKGWKKARRATRSFVSGAREHVT